MVLRYSAYERDFFGKLKLRDILELGWDESQLGKENDTLLLREWLKCYTNKKNDREWFFINIQEVSNER